MSCGQWGYYNRNCRERSKSSNMTKWHILCSTGIGRECGLDKGMECIHWFLVVGWWWTIVVVATVDGRGPLDGHGKTDNFCGKWKVHNYKPYKEWECSTVIIIHCVDTMIEGGSIVCCCVECCHNLDTEQSEWLLPATSPKKLKNTRWQPWFQK